MISGTALILVGLFANMPQAISVAVLALGSLNVIVKTIIYTVRLLKR